MQKFRKISLVGTFLGLGALGIGVFNPPVARSADFDGDQRQDLVVIQKKETETGTTEVNVLSGGSNFQEFILQTGTGLQETMGGQFTFDVAELDGDGKPDFIAVKKNGTATGTIEVNVLSGASTYQEFILQIGTPLEETKKNLTLEVTDFDKDGKEDLLAIKKSKTATGTIEVNVLSGASNYQNFILQTSTALEETGENVVFETNFWDGDEIPDLFAIKKSGPWSLNEPPTETTEVKVLSGGSNFQNLILQTGTPLEPTGDNYDFELVDWNRDGKSDLFANKKNGTATGTTEVKVLSGASNFQEFILQTGTPLEETGDNFDKLGFAINDDQPFQPVPEPRSDATMVGIGVIGAGVLLRRRRRFHQRS